MTAFTTAINDIFSCKDFLEHAQIGDEIYEVICSAVGDGIVYSDAGTVSDVSFKLALKLPLQKIPKVGDKIRFRGEQYKVASMETDSAAASMYVFLQSLSKGIS